MPKPKYESAGMQNLVLAHVREFNSLRPKSHTYSVPPYALEDEMLGLYGQSLENARSQVIEMDDVYTNLASRLTEVCDNDTVS